MNAFTAAAGSLFTPALLGQILSGIDIILPFVPGGAAVAPILTILEKVVPVVVKEAQDLTPIVKNIITTLKADPATTGAQLAALIEQEAVLDAAFDAAAAAAEAEDAGQ